MCAISPSPASGALPEEVYVSCGDAHGDAEDALSSGAAMSALTTWIRSSGDHGPRAPLESTENLAVNATGCVRKEAT